MSWSRFAVAGALAFAVNVAAHGTVQQIKIGSEYFTGYSPVFQYQDPEPVVIGWSIPEDLDNGFVPPSSYADADIICHKGATNAGTSATVAAGSSIDLLWTVWPDSHHGPVLDYLAPCNGDCTTVDKTTLEFFKIDEAGLIDDSEIPGTWASDQLIANNNTWSVTIPSDIAPGSYVLRHEIIALHSAGSVDGAQNYPQCINLEITGSGTATPAGVLATSFYTETDPGIEVNIYESLSYTIPGPAVYTASGGNAASATSVASSKSATAAAASTTALSSATKAAVLTTTSLNVIPFQTVAPFANTTVATSAKATSTPAAIVSSSTSTSCTSTTSTITVTPVISATATTEASSLATTSIAGVAAIITSSSATTAAAATPSATTSAVPTTITTTVDEMPAGTTLTDLLVWLQTMVSDILAGKQSVSRRHAREF